MCRVFLPKGTPTMNLADLKGAIEKFERIVAAKAQFEADFAEAEAFIVDTKARVEAFEAKLKLQIQAIVS